jgi:hypothetical protein
MKTKLTNGDTIETYTDETGTYSACYQIGNKTGDCYQKADEVTNEIEVEPKTLLTLEVGNSREMKWEIGQEDGEGNYSEFRSGSLAAEGDLEALEELKAEADEVWECSSLATRHNLRKA